MCLYANGISMHDSLNKLEVCYHELCSVLSEQSHSASLWLLYLNCASDAKVAHLAHVVLGSIVE